MQQDDSSPTDESVIAVHTARTWPEAMVVRQLLESAGITSPQIGGGTPLPVPESSPFWRGIRIYVLESEAERARQLIAEHLGATDAETEEGPNEPHGR